MKRMFIAVILAILLLMGCNTESSEQPEVQEASPAIAPTESPPEPTATAIPTDTPEPTATAVPTDTPNPTDTPIPTATPEPTDTPEPTKTPRPTQTPGPPSAFSINPDDLSGDGCPVVSLDQRAWSPINAFYVPANAPDARFAFSTNEDEFAFSAFLFDFGPWTGQLGTFDISCGPTSGNFCIFLRTDEVNEFYAAEGEIHIVALEQKDGQLTGPVEFTLTNMTMRPHFIGGNNEQGQGCYYIDEVTIKLNGP